MKAEMYSLVDEDFLAEFQENHAVFMKAYYYDYYRVVCMHIKRKPLSAENFFHNMHRRRFQLFQLCCPYCGAIEVVVLDKRLQGKQELNYCGRCGRGSAFSNMMNQMNRFLRISRVNKIGLNVLKEKNPEKEDWIIGYDCYQMEVIELASIIEVILRDYFEALYFVESLSIRNEYIDRIVKKDTGNDFMNIEKASKIYKKAFGIDIKKKLEEDVWEDLIDIVNLRNMMVHNNGFIDQHFRTTSTYDRLKRRTNGNLLMLEADDIQKYLRSVTCAVVDVSNLFLERYYNERNTVIANYYFNKGLESQKSVPLK